MMKLSRRKILKFFSGFASLVGLAMLFSGLVKQVLLAPNFDANQQYADLSWGTLLLIGSGILLVLTGTFAYLVFSKNKRLKRVSVRWR